MLYANVETRRMLTCMCALLVCVGMPRAYRCSFDSPAEKIRLDTEQSGEVEKKSASYVCTMM